MWKTELAVAAEAARAAGDILRDRFGRTNRIEKKGVIDLVTDADLKAERAVLDILRHRLPGDRILSEEAGQTDAPSNRTWLVDPLDGTTNFAHGFPFFAVSIALEADGDLVLGIVYNPWQNECFEAAAGAGAFLNGAPIRVSAVDNLQEALLGTGFPYDIHERSESVMDLFTRMVVRAQGVRRPGSAALDLCYLAAGRLDAFWESGLKPWDTAAGAVIVKEAGGAISTFEGAPFSPYADTLVASNGPLHQAMLEITRL
jgi:myo-inositol-1(or 4)-monophosphatase